MLPPALVVFLFPLMITSQFFHIIKHGLKPFFFIL